ncbi:MAG: hypothetical protein IKQ41_03785 [Clostridia bacterium]|nr:hypothetical protein [Clostridia bacterium]
MKKTALAGIFLLTLCLALLPAGAAAETRQGVIALEGQEETIEETLLESGMGFSVWYANERLEAYAGEMDGMEGVVVKSLYADDYMVLSAITEEDAMEYAEDPDMGKAGSLTQTDVYRELEGGRYYFMTLVAENGHYLSAVGEYSEEAAEGTAKFFQRVLDSVVFTAAYDTGFSKELPGEWADEYEGKAAILRLEKNGLLSLVCYGTDGGFSYTYRGTWSHASSAEYSDQLTLKFNQTDNPLYEGKEYSVECVYAAYTEGWTENDTQITALILDVISSSGASPFEDIFGESGAALYRKQEPNMRVVNCKEYVSLRAERSKSSKRVAKVPLGALVLAYPEYGQKNGFIYCVYEDREGYILSEYLEPVQQNGAQETMAGE